MIRFLLALLCVSVACIGQVLEAPVRPEVRNSIGREPTYTEVSTPPGTVSLSGVIGGTITGWGSPVGAPEGFKRISVPITCSVSGYVATRVRARVRENDYTGTLLADETVTVALTLGVTRTVSITFDSEVANASGTNLWVEILTDGRIDEWRIDSTPYSSPTARYWTDASVTSPSGSPLAATNQRNYPVTFFSEDATTTTPALSDTMIGLVESDTLLSRIVVPTYGIDATTVLGSATIYKMVTSSTFSGWGQKLPDTYSTNAWDAVSLYLYPFDSSYVPTQVRVRIRELPADVAEWTNNPSTFTVVADTTVDVAPAASAFTKMTATFSAPLYGTNLWLEYLCNGRDGGRLAHQTDTNLISNPPGRWYITGSSLYSGTWLQASSSLAFYVELGEQTADASSYAVTEEFKAKLGTVASTETVSIHLPATVWALEGREHNIYLDNIIQSSAPLNSLLVDVSGTKGAQYGSFGGFWRFTPAGADAGSTTLTVNVRDVQSGQTYATASATLVTRALAYPAAPVSRRLHCIGDSTLGSSGAAVLAELVNLFNGDANYTLTLAGSNDGTYNDSGAVSRTVRCDAISGWRVDMFSTNSTTAWTEIGGTARTGSPFVFSGAFNYATFLSTNSITMSSGDWVLFHLGINDIFSFSDDANLQTQIEDMVTRLEAMITSIQSAVAGVRIVICTTIPPNANQDSFAVDYGVNQNRTRYRRNLELWNSRILTQFGGRTASSIYVLGYGATLDSVNNFSSSAQAVNARNASTYSQPSAGSSVHPAPAGYYQLADTIRAFLKGIE